MVFAYSRPQQLSSKMALSHARGAADTLSFASRYAALQRVFNDQLREWHWQRKGGTFFQIWQPPGVIFSCLQKDHHLHGQRVPAWESWGFNDPKVPTRLVLRALGGRWVSWKAMQRRQERWVIADSNDGHLFNAFVRAMDFYGIDAKDPESSFPNIRLLYAHARSALAFFPKQSLRSLHIHFPWAQRSSAPRRAAMVNLQLLLDACSILEPRGELHIVADKEELIQEACAMLTKSQLFTPSFGFPFHVEGLPKSYPGKDHLLADRTIVTGQSSKDAALFYTSWEKKPPELPNFRFRGGVPSLPLLLVTLQMLSYCNSFATVFDKVIARLGLSLNKSEA
ncbi:unnamed protein product [Durusdinium trenchii]|uniref:tRNA (guanine(46)-N(7))-methyltransferase n=1 Tax=Durusdinium trenchii TaxID=1381693 RepID=A0ABP0SX89_9DINO